MHIDERIDNGIEWLEENGIDNWATILLDADDFNIDSSCHCVVGLTLGDFDIYSEITAELADYENDIFPESGYRLGFLSYDTDEQEDGVSVWGKDQDFVESLVGPWSMEYVPAILAHSLELAWLYRARKSLEAAKEIH